MDKLLSEYKRVAKEMPDLSPIEVLKELATILPTYISFWEGGLLAPNGTISSYTVKIDIYRHHTFVFSGGSSSEIEERAAKIVFAALEKKPLPQQSMHPPFSSNEIIPKNFSSNSAELQQRFSLLEANGYRVQLLNEVRPNGVNGDLLFVYRIRVYGLCDVTGESESNLEDAYSIAGDKFKAIFSANSQHQALEPNIRTNDVTVTQSHSSQSVLEMIGFESSSPTPMSTPETRLSKRFLPFTKKDECDLQLTECDYLWIGLINSFNKVSKAEPSRVDVIQGLIDSGFMRYSNSTKISFDATKQKVQRCKSFLHFATETIFKEDLTEDIVREKIYKAAFKILSEVSNLLFHFNACPSSYQSSLEIVEYLQTRNEFKSILKINPPKVFNAKGLKHQTFTGGVFLLNMYNQEATSDSLIEAQEASCSSFVDYLKGISKFICDSSHEMVHSESHTPSKSGNGQEQDLLINGGDNSGCYIASPKKSNDCDTPLTLNRSNSGRTVCPYSASDLRRAIQSLQVVVKPTYINPVKVISNAVSEVKELAKLIGKFISVYNVNLMPEQIIERLIEVSEREQFIPELVKDKSNVFIYHITSKVLGVFFGTSACERVARINSFKQMFELLHKLSYLISTFKLLRQVPLGRSEFLQIFANLNQELVCMRTMQDHQNTYQSVFTVECLHLSFEETGNSANESKWRVLQKVVDYFEELFNLVGSCISTNKPKHHDNLTHLGRVVYRRPVPTQMPMALLKAHPRVCGSLNAMILVQEFIKTYRIFQGSDKPKIELMHELIKRVDSAGKEKTFNRKTKSEIKRSRPRDCEYNISDDKRYQTQILVAHLGCFTTMKDDRTDSKNAAYQMVYDRLFALASFIIRAQAITKTDINPELIDKFCGQFSSEIFYVHIEDLSVTLKTVKFRVTHIGTYEGVGLTVEEAKMVAFENMVDNLLFLKADAIREINCREIKHLENQQLMLAIEKAVSDSGVGEDVNPSIAARAKLVKDFKAVFSPKKTPTMIIKELSTTTADLSFLKIDSFYDGDMMAYKTTISITDIGDFYCMDPSGFEGVDRCCQDVCNFVLHLIKLIDGFKDSYAYSKVPSVIILDLMENDYELLHLEAPIEPTPDGQFLSVVMMDRMRTFGCTAPSAVDAFADASNLAVEYLIKLVEAILGPL